MLVVSDSGCNLHLPRRLKYFGPEAQMMKEVITNLPSDAGSHNYICSLGHSHTLIVEVSAPECFVAGVGEFNSPS
jgi:hypothetical protein